MEPWNLASMRPAQWDVPAPLPSTDIWVLRLLLTASGKIVDHPEKLKYAELDYVPPKPEAFRHELNGGISAYVAENPEAAAGPHADGRPRGDSRVR